MSVADRTRALDALAPSPMTFEEKWDRIERLGRIASRLYRAGFTAMLFGVFVVQVFDPLLALLFVSGAGVVAVSLGLLVDRRATAAVNDVTRHNKRGTP